MCYRHFLVVFLAVLNVVNCDKFKVIREWRYLNFTWPGTEEYRIAVAKGLYVPENNIIAGIKFFGDSFYVTLPRMKNGVPATLAKIPAGIVEDTAPSLSPFPSFEMNTLGDCNALQNVQNVEIDTKGQMWIIDSGRTETLSTTPTVRCPPKLIIFDIKKNMTTTAYTFPDSVANFKTNFLYDIVVDETDGGYAYITDNSAKDPGIIVFSVKDHHSWKIRHSQSMKADPSASAFRVGPTIIQAPINLASIALGPKVRISNGKITVKEDREVYYAPLSSLHLYSLNTSVLRTEMNGMNNGEYQGEVKDLGIKGSQSVGMVMDNNGTLYYSMLATNSIARWNTQLPFQNSQQVIARDPTYLEWPNSFTFDQSGNITVVVNKLNRFIYDKIDLNQANFRLITSRIGTKSYLYDQTYDYTTEPNKEVLVPQPPNDKAAVQNPDLPVSGILRPGSDQDPYLAPQPVPKSSTTSVPEPSPTAEPTPEPTPEPVPQEANDRMDHDHMDHDHMDHMHDHMKQDHMNHDHMNQDQMNQENMNHSQAMNQSTVPSVTEEPKGAAPHLVASFIGIIAAGTLFLL